MGIYNQKTVSADSELSAGALRFQVWSTRMTRKTMDRRTFTGGLLCASVGASIAADYPIRADAQVTGGDAALPVQSAPLKPKAVAQNKKPSPLVEDEPFAGDLTFEWHEFAPRAWPFAPAEVELSPGPLQQSRDWNTGYMLRIANDRLLHNFRLTAGIASTAKPLGGWESPNIELRGHFVGHYLSAAAILYASTGNEAIRQKADALVAGIAECQSMLNNNGYVSAFPSEFFDRLDRREPVWAPFYTLHKVMAGLLDMHIYAGNRQALDVVTRLAGWVDAWTATKSHEHMQDILNTEFGGMNEVLYNLAAVAKDKRWVRTGDRFTKTKFFNPLASNRDELKGLHANTHMPQVVGAARRFELSSDPRFAAVSRFFWETIAETRTYAPGGSANTESWLTNANHIALEMKASSHHQECCCSYNMMKLVRHLFCWNPDPRYVDYYERNLLNHRLGAIEPETGHTTYFLSMSPAAWKTTCTEDETFWCCTGTAVEEFAKLNDSIYFHDRNGIYVNLFANSTLHWKDRSIKLKQTTRFPESDRTLLEIEAAPSETWSMYLRIPAWTSQDASVRLNGQAIDAAVMPGAYLRLHRAWKAGDRVELTVPMRLTTEALADDLRQQAFVYGPLVLAGQFPKTGIGFDLEHNQGPEIQEAPAIEIPALKAAGTELADWIKPVAGQPLTFRTTAQATDVTLKPLNQSWERFAVYWKMS